MATRYGSPVFTGLPTPRKRRLIGLAIISVMLALTFFLHYTDSGQTIYSRIMDPATSGPSVGWDTPAESTGREPSAPGWGVGDKQHPGYRGGPGIGLYEGDQP